MSQRLPARLVEFLRSPKIHYAALALFAVYIWVGRIRDLELEYASYGFGPISVAYKAVDPEILSRDFPGGAEQFLKSAVMWVYPLALSVFGVAPEALLPVVVALEIAAIVVAMIALTRAVRPTAPSVVSSLVAALVLASGARDMNLAGFILPFFWGLYYNVADALRILAIVVIVKRRSVLGGVLLGASVLCHPPMGLMGAVFVGAVLLARPREMLQRSTLAGAALFVLIAGAWVAAVVRPWAAAGGPFPNQLWIDLTKLMSFHWYAIENGLLTANGAARVTHFCSFLILVAFYMTREERLSGVDRGMALGMLAMLLLVALGLGFPMFTKSPTLIKLSLHRASGLVLTVGLVYVVAGLWGDLGAAGLWRLLVVFPILISPFATWRGFPLFFSVLLVAPAWLAVCRGKWRAGDLVVTALVVVGLVIVVASSERGTRGLLGVVAYTGGRGFLRIALGAGAAVVALLILSRRWFGRDLVKAAAFLGFAGFAVNCALALRLGPRKAAFGRSYKAAQVWARDNTPKNALFMVDPAVCYPAIGYGWREYSRRSCFGNLREWLYSGWVYASDFELCQEGLRRLSEFGVDVRDYFGRKPPIAGFEALRRFVRRRYYGADDAWRLDLARRYGIDYFVFRKLRRAPHRQLPIVYENKRFIVRAARQPARQDTPGASRPGK